MAERIVMRTGEALVEGDKDYLCAEYFGRARR